MISIHCEMNDFIGLQDITVYLLFLSHD